MRRLRRFSSLGSLDGAGRSARAAFAFAVVLVGLLAVGCRSRFISATIANDTDHPVQMVELDYPGGSFGVSVLAPHAVYSYRFKAIGSGALALSYSEAGGVARAGVARTSAGPTAGDGQGGSLSVRIHEGGAVEWGPLLGAK